MVERCRARHVIGGVLSRVREGAGGRAVLVTGAPGMGKTSLIRHAQELAEESGAIVMTAVASPAERDLPLGVVSQLLATASLPPGQAGELAEFAEFTEFIEGPAPVMAKAADSLYRHLALLARRAPVVLTVDDAQDIDAASLQCLQHLMRRVGALRVLVVLGERAGGGRQGSSALTADCLCNPECTLIRLSPLCAECTESLIAEHLGDDRAAHAAPALRRASGGSPLLLQALLWDRSAERLAEDGTPAGGELFRLAVQYVLDQLGPDELRVARALAVLGASATHDFLDRVLRLRTALAMSALDAVGLTEAGRYRTEEARTTVLEGVTPEERAALHRTAARVLHESGAAAGQVARHLVCAGPCADPWAIPVLREAAAQALADHDAEGAVTCLRRAYDTSTSAPQRAVIRVELTRAEWETDPGAVRRHLTELLDDHANGYLSCGQSMTLITYLLWLGRPEEAATLFADLDGVRDELSGEIRVRLDTMHVWFAYFYPVLGAHEHAAAPAEATGIGGVMAVDPHSDGALVLSSLLSGGPTSGALDAAERLLESVVLHDPPVAPAMAALVSLIRAARLDRAAEWCELLVRGAGPRTPQARAIFAAASATVESWLGNFEVARQRADEALTLIPPQAWGVALGLPLSAKVLACAELGDIEASAECFRVPVPPVMFQTLPGLHYLQARGRHHLSVGRYQAALGDFYACRDLMAAWKLDVSVFTAWRVYAAEALIEVDSPGRARELLTAELAEPDPGSSWLRSRAVALFERVNSHVPEPTETPSARTPLRAPAGIPKQPLTPSPGPERGTAEGLTRAEQRVALMASDGLTNRDIAERLFITPSTVEQHLTRIYHKLGVRGRRALPQALADRTVIRP
ncbi:AAA family ATPase [Streptomyces sp. NPDC059900]|uniref:helix-turn-helix transcriptional regulator n=1 Tax=Streptomyces sp. NPDC059900 TaxID=3155816 RepID=UPI00343E04C9